MIFGVDWPNFLVFLRFSGELMISANLNDQNDQFLTGIAINWWFSGVLVIFSAVFPRFSAVFNGFWVIFLEFPPKTSHSPFFSLLWQEKVLSPIVSILYWFSVFRLRHNLSVPLFKDQYHLSTRFSDDFLCLGADFWCDFEVFHRIFQRIGAFCSIFSLFLYSDLKFGRIPPGNPSKFAFEPSFLKFLPLQDPSEKSTVPTLSGADFQSFCWKINEFCGFPWIF